jgi:hypothetical protein
MTGRPIWVAFRATVGILAIVVVVGVIRAFVRALHRLVLPWGLVGAVVILVGLGLTTLVLTARTTAGGSLKKFLLLAEASFLGLPVSFLPVFAKERMGPAYKGLYGIAKGQATCAHPANPNRMLKKSLKIADFV